MSHSGGAAKEPHVCIEKSLPAHLLAGAAALAIEENEDNRPRGEVTGQLGVGIPNHRETFGALLTGKKWKNGRRLRVWHMNGDPQIHARVERAAKQWEQYANITFDFVQDSDAEIRISYSNDNQSWSLIGTDALSAPKNSETMHYGWLTPQTSDEELNRVVAHEFGHALGMIHEHQSPAVEIKWDKPVVYRYYMDQLHWTRAAVDSNIFARVSAQGTQFTRWDQLSIMHYPVPAEFTIDGKAVGWNMHLSDIDKYFIGQIYPRPAAAPPPGAGMGTPPPAEEAQPKTVSFRFG